MFLQPLYPLIFMATSALMVGTVIPIAEVINFPDIDVDRAETRSKGVIIDLDGTLADVDHRLHHIKKNPKDRETFHSLMGEDEVNLWCLELLEAMKGKGHRIILVTGRAETYREDTVNWLERKKIPYDELYMNPDKGVVKDYDFKKTVYENFIRDRIDVLFVVEDRSRVVDMWRELGLTCLQCELGEF